MPNAYKILRYEEAPHFFTFTTDSGIIYSCYFGIEPNTSPLLGIYDWEVRDFIFEPHYPTKAFKKLPDQRVHDTIMVLMNEYFSNKNCILLYICDDSDGISKARARQRLFTEWHEAVADTIVLHTIEVRVTLLNITQYGGVLVHKDCPHAAIVERELIDKTSTMLREKYGE